MRVSILPAKAIPRRRVKSAHSIDTKNARPDSLEPSFQEPSSSGPCVAGIGASAGGYDAIRKLFRVMPADTGIAFVVLQHLDPSFASLAVELFGKCTSMPVKEAENGMLLEANHVYVSPSNKDIEVRKGCVVLIARSNLQRPRLPIDHLFQTLGDDCGAKAIGILLSGTGTDGTLGLKTISANGGIVLVQDPATAQFDGMPRSAIGSGMTNYVLPVEKMPEVLVRYARHPYATSPESPTQEGSGGSALLDMLAIVKGQRGYDFSGYKRGTLRRRIQRRMSLRGVLHEADYAQVLKNEPGEVDALFRDLLIGVTEFFRDAEAWKILETEVIAPLVAGKNRDEPIRIWIPGTSSGEEAYSMAMLVLDNLRQARKTCPVQIFATDTSDEALEIGRRGRYPMGIAMQISPARLRRYFVEVPDHQCFQVSQTLREAVVFGVQNLFADPPLARVDLISCRNVLIYLEHEIQRRIIGIFHFALRPEACLFLGSAESIGGHNELFKTISATWRIYRREGRARSVAPALTPQAGEARAGSPFTSTRSAPRQTQASSIAQQLILDRFAPASVLVNSNYEALYFCGPTEEFLVRPRGTPTQDLLAMVRDGLRSRVRSALREAALRDAPVTVADARMKRGDGFEPLQVTVTPAPGGDLGALFLVVFQREPKPTLILGEKSAEGALVRQFEDDLRATRDDLQSTIECLEVSNEDLTISNEEVVSVNEELRSLNEELESSKEELQSLNEELTTVNQQLQAKLHELEISNDDLENLLASSDIATICLDLEFRIKWFSPATQKLFNFIPSDIGRPIRNFSSSFGGADLIEVAEKVLVNAVSIQSESQTEQGRWYLRCVMPYRTEETRISGVIMTYTDITESRAATETARVASSNLDEAHERERELRERSEKLRALAAALAMAEERERRLLAQDLHDDLGQLIAVIKLKLSALGAMDLSAAQRQALDDSLTVVEQAVRTLRTMSFKLSPPMLYDLGLVSALEWLADEIRYVYKLEVHIEDDGAAKPLDPAVGATLFRAVRELLINVVKHAKVTAATISAKVENGQRLIVEVSDAGVGFDIDALPVTNGGPRFGLLSLRERLGYLDGTVGVRSIPGDGTSVTLNVPLQGTTTSADQRITQEWQK